MTPIQQHIIPELIARNNVLGLARVGSGKTLAYLVPIVQHLLSKRWSSFDGLGALIIVPTRELGIQIFTVMNQIAKGAKLSCGIICGGHKFDEEQKLIAQMNVLIATPGRLLQHLSQFKGNIGDQLQYIIFDEVDQLLEQGFLKQLKQIFEYFPQPYLNEQKQPSRVLGMFSATQSQRLMALLKHIFDQKLSILNLDVQADTKQPTELQQPLQTVLQIQLDSEQQSSNLRSIVSLVHPADKIDMLFSFMRSFPQCKSVVFFNTCNQASFIYSLFVKLNVGCNLIKLTSKMSQPNRTEAFLTFKKDQFGYLLTTDVVARGIDITDIRNVIQFDCPNSVQQYIHRCGRSTRMNNRGLNVMFLATMEKNFLNYLKKQNLEFDEKFMKLRNAVSIRQATMMMCASDPRLRDQAQRAVQSYAKSIYVAQDKQVFNYEQYDFSVISQSYGLDVQVDLNEQENEEEEEDILQVKSVAQGAALVQPKEEVPAKEQKKLSTNEMHQLMAQRINEIQAKVGKKDAEDRKEHNKIIKKMKHGDMESDESQDQDQSELQEYGEEFGEEYGEEFGEEMGEEIETIDWVQ